MKLACVAAALCVATAAAAAGEAALDALVKQHGVASSWTTATVVEVFEGLGFTKATTDNLLEHKVDGLVLFDLDEKALDFLKVSPIDAARFRAVISKLHKSVSDQDLHVSDLWDVRALHRNKFHTLVTAAHMSPFTTALYVHLFHPDLDDLVFGSERAVVEPAFSWFWWLVCPARIVWNFLAPFWDTNPLLCLALLLPVVVQQLNTYLLLATGQLKQLVLSTVAVAVFTLVFAVFHYFILFPLTPWFFTNVSFYLSIVVTTAVGILAGINLVIVSLKAWLKSRPKTL